jgi:subtilisin family serine protease
MRRASGRSGSRAPVRAAAAALARAAALALACALAGAPAGPAAGAAPPEHPPAGSPPTAGPGETVVWVRFADRGALAHAPAAAHQRSARAQVSERCLARRARRGGGVGLLESDLPVDAHYVAELAARGFRVRAVSRWLNAASAVVPVVRLGELFRLPFVSGVEPVPFTRVPPIDRGLDESPGAAPLRPEQARALAARGRAAAPGDPAFYGYSYAQDHLIQADALHAAGLSGRGVLVAILDVGFHETHVAFDSLDVVARRDFIFGDTVVDDQPAQDPLGEADHGTATLSVLAADAPGTLVGTAFHAQVALGKTEWDPTETPVEMDYWQMGAEWADSLGADVISSSLGYTEFDPPWPSYTYADMNGHTTVVTQAAAEAALRGITVVTAQGNEGDKSWHYLIAPADAESACSVGAVDSTNVIALFSSYGPTADGRVKPDVCAMGVKTRFAQPGNDTGTFAGNGTSYATPAVAGLVALLLEAHPEWGPGAVLQALRSTADRFATPDAQHGYGTARGVGAAAWVPTTGAPGAGAGAGGLEVLGPNPVVAPGRVALLARMGAVGGEAVLDVFDVRGRRVVDLLRRSLPAGDDRMVYWNGTDGTGRRVPGGVYFVRFTAPGVGHNGRIVVFP